MYCVLFSSARIRSDFVGGGGEEPNPHERLTPYGSMYV